MMYDLWELIGRYFLTGVILWGVLFIMLVIRLIWLCMKSEWGIFGFLDKFGNVLDADERKMPFIRRIVNDMIFWPYGMIRTVDYYMKVETRTLRETTKTE